MPPPGGAGKGAGVGLGWYEAYVSSGKPEFVNLDMCWRLSVESSATTDGPCAVWAWFGERSVMLAGTHGTEEEAGTYLREIFEDADGREDVDG